MLISLQTRCFNTIDIEVSMAMFKAHKLHGCKQTCMSVFSHTSSHSASVLSSRVKNTVIPCPIFLVISAITSWYNLLRLLNSWDICNGTKSWWAQTYQTNFLIRISMFSIHYINIRWGRKHPKCRSNLTGISFDSKPVESCSFLHKTVTQALSYIAGVPIISSSDFDQSFRETTWVWNKLSISNL